MVQPPRINVASRFAALTNANGSNVGTSATGVGITELDRKKAADFRFHTDLQTWADAEQVCRDEGGHLADYQSFIEQYGDEKWYIDEGYLFPKYHKVYWMGLSTDDDFWPTFFWANPLVNGPTASDFNNWGTMRCGRGRRM